MARAKQKSDVGTAMARMNDALFSFASEVPVIPGIESMDEWQALRDTLVANTPKTSILRNGIHFRYEQRDITRIRTGQSANPL